MSSVLIFGKPNSGKSLLFNRFTGLKQRVVNFPGVTIEVKRGRDGDVEYIDHPGVYSFNPLTRDEKIALESFYQAVKESETGLIVCVLDATRLEQSLTLGLEAEAIAAKSNKAFVYALNMMDEIEAGGVDLDFTALTAKLNSPVIAVSARTKNGLADLKSKIHEILRQTKEFVPTVEPTEHNSFRLQARKLAEEVLPKSKLILKRQGFMDRIFLSSTFGGLIFFAIMFMMFQSIFTWAVPLMDGVEAIIEWLAAVTTGFLPTGLVSDFFNDAIFGGFGSFLVFVPQIFVLTFIIGVLEDSGYLARAAVICHRPFNYFGLTGKSFIPLLAGHACAIPAIFSARTIESPKRRLLTLAITPLMSCTARLPVYALFISAIIPSVTYVGGLLNLQGMVFFALYAVGITTGLVVSTILSRTKYKAESDSPFILELPPYRLPQIKPLFLKSLNSSWLFITKAGGIIFMVTVVVWVLGYFPQGSGHLETSWLATMGHWIEPLFKPFDLDWKYGVAILASFLAREVFVGTLGTFFGIEGAEENVAGLAESIQASGLSLASGLAMLVFFVVALQCVSTLAVLKKEVGTWKFPVGLFLAYSALAYALAWITYSLTNLIVA